MNIVDIAAGSDDFNLLVRALQTVNLAETVRDATDVTVFAPTDAAFTQLASDLGFDGDASDEDAVFNFLVAALTDLGGGDPAPVLTDILLYHVSAGAKSEEEIEAAGSIATLLAGAAITPDGGSLVDQEPDIADATIVAPDIAADNGTIQGIDRVLLPIDIPGNTNIVDIAAGSDDFNLLVRALQTVDLVDTVRNSEDITVFAPTDAAFTQLASDLGYDGDASDEDAVFNFLVAALTDLGGGDPAPVLTDILLYHVSAGAKSETEIEAAGSIATLLSGATISPDGENLVDQEPDIADPKIVAPDIAADNGTIQGIDRVLLPIDIPGNTNIVDIAAGSDDFNLLVRALQTVDLVDTVRNSEDITVFAPTDAAFTQLASDLGYDGDASDEDAVFNFLVAALTDLGGGDPAPVLTDILLYHVSAGAKTAAEIEAAGSVSTLLTGVAITPDGDELGDQETDIPDPSIALPDIAAANGTIQGIDRVLLPLDIPGNDRVSITEIVGASGEGFDENGGDFDILLSAVGAAGLAGALAAEDADLTVFAPTDDAFVALAQTLGFAGSDEAGAWTYIQQAATLLSRGGDPLPLLTDILTYHVVPGARDAAEVLASSLLQTLQGGNLGVDGASLVDQDPDIANPNITATNIYASNGIVHAIDGVLLPVDVLPTDGSDAVDFLIGDGTAENFDLGADNDWVDAGDGNDTVIAGDGTDVILGGGGLDTVILNGQSNAYGLQISADSATATNKTDETDENFLRDVELLKFVDGFGFLKDGSVDLGKLSGAAQLSSAQMEDLVELYVAYFNRAPDALGILFWGSALNDGVTLPEIAELFFDQPEARSKLPPETDAPAFVDLAYAHLLERSADAAGRSFWIDQLEQGNVSRAEFMLELIAGARANTDAAEDIRTIEDKTDIGVSYALIAGLTDADDAETVLDAYDRDDAAASLSVAQSLVADFAADANGANGSTELTVQLVGVVDDPFGV